MGQSKQAQVNAAALASLSSALPAALEIKPGYMVQVHISPVIQAELKRLADQYSQDEQATMSSLIFSHFEAASDNLRAIVDEPYSYHVFTTYFVDAQIAMTLIGFGTQIDGFLLHKREANTLTAEMSKGHTHVDLGWMTFVFEDVIGSANIESTVL